MGSFELIKQKKYGEFCDLYLEKSHLRATHPEYADLMPGNFITALLGAKRYETLVSFCRDSIEKIRAKSGKIDRSSSNYFIGMSIGYFELKKYPDALKALQEGAYAAYQDRTRTQAACIMYCEAVMLNDKKARGESRKILNSRLRNKDTSLPEYGPANFLTDRCGSAEMLAQIDSLPPVLKERELTRAFFYVAVKAFENGNLEEYGKNINAACDLYKAEPRVTVEFEYHLAEICRDKIGKQPKS